MVSAAELKQPLSWSARGDTTRGLRELEALAALAPDDAAIQNALGSLHAAGGAFDQASLHFRRALELRPRYLTAGVNLGTALLELGALNESLALLEIAVTQPDGPAPAEVSLGRALCLLGRHADAQIAFERALTRKHAHAGTVSQRCYASLLDPALTARQIAEIHMRSVRRLLAADAPKHFANDRDTTRKLRIGTSRPTSANTRSHASSKAY
jgi:tetratricopeptide (TPR) repeat protein